MSDNDELHLFDPNDFCEYYAGLKPAKIHHKDIKTPSCKHCGGKNPIFFPELVTAVTSTTSISTNTINIKTDPEQNSSTQPRRHERTLPTQWDVIVDLDPVRKPRPRPFARKEQIAESLFIPEARSRHVGEAQQLRQEKIEQHTTSNRKLEVDHNAEYHFIVGVYIFFYKNIELSNSGCWRKENIQLTVVLLNKKVTYDEFHSELWIDTKQQLKRSRDLRVLEPTGAGTWEIARVPPTKRDDPTLIQHWAGNKWIHEIVNGPLTKVKQPGSSVSECKLWFVWRPDTPDEPLPRSPSPLATASSTSTPKPRKVTKLLFKAEAASPSVKWEPGTKPESSSSSRTSEKRPRSRGSEITGYDGMITRLRTKGPSQELLEIDGETEDDGQNTTGTEDQREAGAGEGDQEERVDHIDEEGEGVEEDENDEDLPEIEAITGAVKRTMSPRKKKKGGRRGHRY